MKKKLTAYVIIVLAFCTLLASCKKKVKLVDVSIKEGYEDTIEVGTFDVSNYKIIETYSDDSTEEVDVTLDMISDYERMKIYQIGTHDITVVYMDTEIQIHITITRAVFRCNLYSEDENVVYKGTEEREDSNGGLVPYECYEIVYDGKPHTLDVEGYYPKGTEINYVNGSSFVNVGTYTVKVILNASGYVTNAIYGELVIKEATYDMSKIDLPKETNLLYNEEDHVFKVNEEDLPEGVTVSYTINSNSGNTARDAGIYTVIASFSSENPNYVNIPSISRIYTIEKAEFSTEEIVVGYIPDTKKVAGQNVVYNGEPYQFMIITTLPSWITPKYVNYIDTSDESRVVVSNGITYVKNSTGEYKKKEDGTFEKTDIGGSYIIVNSLEYVRATGDHYISLSNPYYLKVNDSYVDYYVKTLSDTYIQKTDNVFYAKNSRGEYSVSAEGNYILMSDGTFQKVQAGYYYKNGEEYALAENSDLYVLYTNENGTYSEYISINEKHYIKASLDYFEEKEPGTYSMEIEFKVDNQNYKEIPSMVFEISIFEKK